MGDEEEGAGGKRKPEKEAPGGNRQNSERALRQRLGVSSFYSRPSQPSQICEALVGPLPSAAIGLGLRHWLLSACAKYEYGPDARSPCQAERLFSRGAFRATAPTSCRTPSVNGAKLHVFSPAPVRPRQCLPDAHVLSASEAAEPLAP